MMGEVLSQTLTGTPTAYQPGHWFNSAKFLDIEYQNYGWAKAKEDEGTVLLGTSLKKSDPYFI
jgi:hypothetical protein